MIARFLAFTAAVLFTIEGPAQHLLVTSLGNFGSSEVYPPYVTFGANEWIASPFYSGTGNWRLTSARLQLAPGTSGSSTARVCLFSDAEDRPGIPLIDFGTKTLSTSNSLSFYPAANTAPLEPLTRYWIGVGNLTTNDELNIAVMGDESFNYTSTADFFMEDIGSDGSGFRGDPPPAWSPLHWDIILLFELNGTPVVVPVPSMLILFVENGRAQISWPQNATGYSLQFTTSLSAPEWFPITDTPTVVGNRFVQLVDTTAEAKFYRLHKP